MASLTCVVEDLARRAGEITLQYFQTSLDVELKSDESPVTVADRKTEEFVRSEIMRLFPGDVVVGEEYGESEGDADARRWIVDPIDGTKSFIHGVPLYGVMIGVEEAGEVVCGAVNIPALGDLVVAGKGEGCWWNGKEARVSSVARIQEALLLTTDIAHFSQHGKAAAWERLCAPVRLMRTWGDCYGHLLVATGRAEIMVDAITNAWDCAPLKIILEEAGGTFTDFDGKPTIYGGCAISTNGVLFEDVMQLVRG